MAPQACRVACSCISLMSNVLGVCSGKPRQQMRHSMGTLQDIEACKMLTCSLRPMVSFTHGG